MPLAYVPGGESALQFDVSKLVDRACLAENAAPVSILEEPHE